jgi:hypothetical protein
MVLASPTLNSVENVTMSLVPPSELSAVMFM